MAFYYATSDLKDAAVVIFGIPYDRSSSFIPGSRFAPSMIRVGTENVESYSPYFDKDVLDIKIHDAGDLVLSFATIKQTFNQIQQSIAKYVKNKKKFVALGGEHTITVPIISELIKYYPDLCLIQFDAHTDTRDEYLGEKFCHATVIKRISEFLPQKNIFQLGLRSLVGPKQNTNQFLFSVENFIPTVIKQIGNKPCYFTLDIDVVDCGLMPAVQTAVPNGINYQELFSSIVKMTGLNFVGCDIVEYNPLADKNLAYASVIAEIVRELIIMLNQNKLKSK
jgi:agmatinase